MGQWYNIAKKRMGEMFFEGGATFKAALLTMSTSANSAAAQDADTVGDLNTISQCTATSYTAGGETLNLTVNVNDTTNNAEVDADPTVFGSLGAGGENIKGVLVYMVSGTMSQSIPVLFNSFSSSKTPDGSAFTVNWSGTGLAQIVDP